MDQIFNVLIIEDEIDIAKLYSAMLKSDLCRTYDIILEPTLAEDIEQARMIIASKKIDIIVLDLFLSDTMGLDSLRALKQFTDLPVIIVTGYDVPGLSYNSFEAGAMDFLSKSEITPTILYKSIIYSLEKDTIIRNKIAMGHSLSTILHNESQQTMERRKLLVDILKLLNAPYSGMDTIKHLLEMIQNFTAIEAIALRLKDGDDYPYFVFKGFDSSFIEKENFLCVYQNGSECPILDGEGIPVLECMCGCVIRGRLDKNSPFVTENGSFWTNSTTKLLNNVVKPKGTRNRCNAEGYESVAIIPLSVGNEIIGSLQLNDRREGVFSNCMIEFLEELAISIAVAVKRAWQEDRIKVMDVAKAMDLLESSRQLNAGIAHELRTPLQAILNSLELIDIFVQDPCPTEICKRECNCPIINDIKSMSKEGIDRADYAINVLNSLSIYSKVATSEKKHLINLFPELTAIIKTLRYTDKFKGMPEDSISLLIGKESCFIQMNKMDFELLMSNLLRNAREAINHSKPKIEIFAEHQSSNIILHVIDNGSGIDPSQGNKIFDPYFTTKGNQETSHDGSGDESNQGLGLAMVRTIIQAHGGTIVYTSVPGRTEFIVTLPCVEKKEVEV